MKMTIFTAFYGKKMTLHDKGSTQYLARVCPRAKPLVFDPLSPITAALKQTTLRSVKIAIFTAFYDKK